MKSNQALVVSFGSNKPSRAGVIGACIAGAMFAVFVFFAF